MFPINMVPYVCLCSRTPNYLLLPRDEFTNQSVLLYGGECWIPLRCHLKQMNTFHHRCICSMLDITNRQQWEKRITSASTQEQWKDVETITEKLMKRCLEWLGHLAGMPSCRIPKMSLFSWLLQTPPRGGPRRRWYDDAL